MKRPPRGVSRQQLQPRWALVLSPAAVSEGSAVHPGGSQHCRPGSCPGRIPDRLMNTGPLTHKAAGDLSDPRHTLGCKTPSRPHGDPGVWAQPRTPPPAGESTLGREPLCASSSCTRNTVPLAPASRARPSESRAAGSCRLPGTRGRAGPALLSSPPASGFCPRPSLQGLGQQRAVTSPPGSEGTPSAKLHPPKRRARRLRTASLGHPGNPPSQPLSLRSPDPKGPEPQRRIPPAKEPGGSCASTVPATTQAAPWVAAHQIGAIPESHWEEVSPAVTTRTLETPTSVKVT